MWEVKTHKINRLVHSKWLKFMNIAKFDTLATISSSLKSFRVDRGMFLVSVFVDSLTVHILNLSLFIGASKTH